MYTPDRQLTPDYKEYCDVCDNQVEETSFIEVLRIDKTLYCCENCVEEIEEENKEILENE